MLDKFQYLRITKNGGCYNKNYVIYLGSLGMFCISHGVYTNLRCWFSFCMKI